MLVAKLHLKQYINLLPISSARDNLYFTQMHNQNVHAISRQVHYTNYWEANIVILSSGDIDEKIILNLFINYFNRSNRSSLELKLLFNVQKTSLSNLTWKEPIPSENFVVFFNPLPTYIEILPKAFTTAAFSKFCSLCLSNHNFSRCTEWRKHTAKLADREYTPQYKNK